MNVRRQQGFTMVELMVALLIGLFLLGGLGILVFDNKRAFVGQGSLAALQDGERMASTIMTDVIQTSGYYPNPQQFTAINQLVAVTPPSVPVAMSAGQAITGVPGAVALGGDTITLRYATNNHDGILLCSGNDNETGTQAYYANTFSVVTNAAGVPQLVCDLSTNGAAPVRYYLVNNVQSISILYGVNSASVANNVDSYMTTAVVTANSLWSSVVSVQLTINFLNPLLAANGNNVVGQGTYKTAAGPIPFVRTVAIMNKAGI
jgi:type IV pilus assembly protein PilW